LGERQAAVIGPAVAGSRLRSLDLSKNALTGEALAQLAAASKTWPRNLALNLEDNALTSGPPIATPAPAVLAIATLLRKCRWLQLRKNALRDWRGAEEAFLECSLDFFGVAENGLFTGPPGAGHGDAPAAESSVNGIELLRPLGNLGAAEVDLRVASLGISGGEWLVESLPAMRSRGLSKIDLRKCDLRFDEAKHFPGGIEYVHDPVLDGVRHMFEARS
jgi:hypothetical protein